MEYQKYSQADISRIHTLRDEKYSLSQIAHKTKWPKSSISFMLRTTNQSENFSRKKSPGRKRKLTKRASSVIQNIVNENPFATANIIRGVLKDKTGINISKQTLIRDMNRNGIRPYVARKKPALRKVNIT
ncbi:hypothetical protein M153_38410001296 [Pseudoloma neurophilia]|uniref:Transposase Tc1-like domain-containing protein n=1 Tax=Pseudoloma neurophilia TaxID=146866 RepID=A0A0R0LT36_9MICR|nr:hypothetical protein M153_38410001296 [Pseudoloma neurophilia]